MNFRGNNYSVFVNIADKAGLEREVRQRFAAGRGFSLATLNLDHLVKLGRSRAFAQAYGGQDLIVADGNPIVWLAKLSGQKLSLVPGSDSVVDLVQWATDNGVSVALFGSTPQALEKSGEALQRLVPGTRIAARISPPFGFDPEGELAQELLEQVKASGARLCLVAFGAPKQEILAARGFASYPEIGFASIGASLDFLSGDQRRAPKWVRRIAMEWLWRMLSNPGRLAKRYLECALILPGHAASAVAQRFESR